MKISLPNRADVLQDRFALKAASYLSAAAADVPYDISERLRAARTQALAKRKLPVSQTASHVSVNGRGTLSMGGSEESLSWWARVGTVVPLVALVVGLLAINSVQSDNRARELAEVDAALLTDVLPPEAFADPGFIQFLKSEP